MNEVRRCIDVEHPPEAVWAVLEDVRLLPELSASTVEVEAPERLTTVGQTFTQTVVLAGRRFRSEWRVEEIETGRRLVVTGSVLPGTSYRMTEEVTPREGGGAQLCLTMQYKLPFGPLGRLASRLGVEQRATREAEEVIAGVARVAGRVHQ